MELSQKAREPLEAVYLIKSARATFQEGYLIKARTAFQEGYLIKSAHSFSRRISHQKHEQLR